MVRVVRVLVALSEVDDYISLGVLAEKVGLPASTVHRMLELLANEGMVERNDGLRMYKPGLEFFRMAASIYGRQSLYSLALPFLRLAVADNNENAYFCLLDQQAGQITFAAVAESSNLLSYRVPLNEKSSLVRGASSLAILAWMSHEDRERVMAAEGLLSGKSSERDKLLEDLSQVVDQGYAQTFGQKIPGAVGIFAPVFNAQSCVIASLGYTVPDMRYHTDSLPKLAEAAIRHAAALSRVLGFRASKAGKPFLTSTNTSTNTSPSKKRLRP